MKSIREKEEEYAPYTREDSWDRIQRYIIAQTSFEAGASYVLDEITEAIRLCDNDRNTNLYSALWDCIDELRK